MRIPWLGTMSIRQSGNECTLKIPAELTPLPLFTPLWLELGPLIFPVHVKGL